MILSSEVEKLREEQDDKTRMDQSNVLALDSLVSRPMMIPLIVKEEPKLSP